MSRVGKMRHVDRWVVGREDSKKWVKETAKRDEEVAGRSRHPITDQI
jgi:hypothetical protein